MADLIRVVLYGVLPASAAALLLVGLLGARWLGVATGLGLLVTHGLLRQRLPALPHALWTSGNDANLWFCWLALATGLVTAMHPRRPWPQLLAVPPGLLVLAAQFWLLLTNRRRRWGFEETVAQHAAFAALAAVVWLATRRLLSARPTPLSVWALALCLGADAALLHLGGSTFQGQIAGAAATAFAAAAGTALWRHGLVFEPAAAFAFAWLHCGLVALGYHVGELPIGAGLAAALAPGAFLLALRGGAARVWTGIAGMLVGLGIAFAIVLWS